VNVGRPLPSPMPLNDRAIEVSAQRVQRLLAELLFALKRLPATEVAKLVGGMPLDFVFSICRRAENMAQLAKTTSVSAYIEAAGLVTAWRKDRFPEHLGDRARSGGEWASEKWEGGRARVAAIQADPIGEALRLSALALAALASSGGFDGDGGLPDMDIALLGIGAHRSPFSHSILIGSSLETLIATFIRISLAVQNKLPPEHDPVWNTLAQHSARLLDAASRGASVGLAYHLLVDGLLQPAPYHGLPLHLPIEVHQAIQTVNGMAEGLDSALREAVKLKTPDLLARHRELLSRPFDVDPAFIGWLARDSRDILERQGNWMLALSMGDIQPFSQLQVRFVQVAWQLVPASSPSERAWIGYINLLRVAAAVARENEPLRRLWRRVTAAGVG
jgi:hypothetical protein